MPLSKANKFEKAVILLLNTFDGWQLSHTGTSNKIFDAEGLTPKGHKCVWDCK